MPKADTRSVPSAHPELSRAINRHLLLNLIRTRQPLSRADLARISGLARGTVSMIIQELIDQRWVAEGLTGRLPLGRRPTFLKLNDERMIVGVDLGPLEATVALFDLTGHLHSQDIVAVPANPQVAVESLIGAIRRITGAAAGKIIEGVGVCMRVGHRTPPSSTHLSAPCIQAGIAEATGFAVNVDSAANACALAAAWFDSGQDWRSRVAVTVADDIDAGIFSSGQMIRGLNGAAGNFGHIGLDPKGPCCQCGGRGCWAVVASNRAALRYYAGRGAQSHGLTFPDLQNLADRGDPTAIEALETMAYWLGVGFRMIVGAVAPDTILVIGDVTRSWDRIRAAVSAGMSNPPMTSEQIPSLIPVPDDGAARLQGAVALVLQERFAG